MDTNRNYSSMRDTLVRNDSEVTAGELRAKRSLRVLHHQEGRISTLENELSEKFSTLQKLQESHTDLMEVHHYQTEVQKLQRQLIKLQEIQYLTEVVQSRIDDDDDKREKKESTNEETFLKDGDMNDRNLSLPKYSPQNALLKSFTTTRSRGGGGGEHACTSNDRKNEDNEKSCGATDNAIASEASEDDSRRKEFCSLKSRLGSIGSLLQYSNANKFGESTSFVKDNRTNFFPRRNPEIGAIEEKNLKLNTRQVSTSNDDVDKLSILKETLSLHKQSIEDLSSEVVHLRKEKSQLLSHVQNLMEWKTEVENAIHVPPDQVKDDVNGNCVEKYVKKDIDVIMPVSRKSFLGSNNDILELRKNQSKHVRLDLGIKTDSSTSNEGSRQSDGDGKSDETKLGARARRIWETACRFFTPEQAHFIISSPLSSDDGENLL